MAIETLILRPTNSTVSDNGFDVTIATNPANTAYSDFYLLVSEEVPDDTSTYIEVGTVGALCFGFTVPEIYMSKTPTSIRVHLQISQSAQAVLQYNIYADPTLNDSTESMVTLAKVSSTASDPAPDYYTLIAEVSSDRIETAWGVITGISDLEPYILVNRGTGTTKNVSTYLTQLYLEVDFDIEDDATTPEIHVKRGGAWLGVTRQFRKADGSWVEITAAEAKEILANNAVEVTS